MLSIREQVNIIITDITKSIADIFFGPDKFNFVSFKKEVISKGIKIKDHNIREFYNNNKNRDINEFKQLISDIKNMESLDNKIDKLSFLDTPLLSNIKNIIESKLKVNDKQLAIETSLIEYELDLFNKHINTPGARSKLLHKIFPQIKKGYEILVKIYSVNKYGKLIKEVDNFKNINTNNLLATRSKEYYISIII
jgi:hypothetical protein